MTNPFIKISTQDLFTSLQDKNSIIIDIRPVDAHNGWKLKGEKRGGHIKGARSISAKWSKYIDWIEIVRSKGITTNQNIILYGYNEQDLEKEALQYISAGYKNVQIYEGFEKEWTVDKKLPMEILGNYKNLVYPLWLNDVLSGKPTQEFDNDKIVLCHAHYRNPDDYNEGHIFGAIAFDSLLLESPEIWNRRSAEEIKANLEKSGITHDTTVVLYGRFSFPDNDDPFPGSSSGHLGAMRCAALMMYAGVKDVRILNGGLQSWLDEGYSITKEPTEAVPVKDFGVAVPACPEFIVDIPEAKEMLASEDAELVCVRSWPEFIGEVSGYNYIEKTGRIPGAIFGNCGSDAYHMENYRNLDHTCL